MIQIVVEQIVRCPPDEVFAYLADFENNPTWQGGMQSARFTSDGPLDVGSTYDQVAKFMGKEIVTSFEVVAFEPGRSITIESRESSMPLKITREVEEHSDGTLVRAHVGGDPSGLFAAVAKPLMKMMVKRSVTSDYARLAEILDRPSE